MKALIISPTWPPTRSGGADFAFNLCERLAERGITVEVVTSIADDLVPSARFRALPIMRDWSWRELPRVLRVMRRFKPDVVEIHFAGGIYHHHPMISFLPWALKKFAANPRLVLRVEYPEPIVSRPRSISSRVMEHALNLYRKVMGLDAGYGTLLRESDAVIVLCDLHAAMLVQTQPDIMKKCITIPPPPSTKLCLDEDGSARENARHRVGVDSADTLLAYYGYVYPNKGLETLFEAVALLVQKKSKMRLVIIGDANEVVLKTLQRPNYLSELKEQIQSLGVTDKVIWTGYFPTDSTEPSSLLRAADICVLPFDDGILMHRSSFGVAAMHGLPTITTRGREIEKAFVDGENVLLCPPKDPVRLASTIQRLMSDPALQKRLREGARNLAEQYFSWDRCIARTLAVFRGETPV